MFRKTNTNKQFSDPTAWHNTFYSQVVNKIDENIFSVLFSEDQGSPNASVKTLISMMILKEGEGYSDEKLFENCRFNLLTRKALGLVNIDDKIPAESTYYLFRKRISEYEEQKKEDLFEKCFQNITEKQIIEFNVSGKSLRADSKLIGSNIAFYSRYELIHRTLLLFYKNVFHKQTSLLSEENQLILADFIKEKAADTVYKSDKKQINKRIIILGKLINSILNVIQGNENKDYITLKQVFLEQYKVLPDSKIDLIPAKEISAQSIQSPYDTDCDFRTKTGKKTKGYSHNITETCDPSNDVNLITNVEVEPASKADNDFVETLVEKSKEILTDKIENLHADGAYHSIENQDYIKEEGINFHLTGFAGKLGRYDLELDGNELQVTDTYTDTLIPVALTKSNKYRIKTEKGYRYFTDKEIESCRLRKKAEELPKEIGNIRNNVEASIFQLAYPLRKDKTKYRGLIKNKIWAILRSLWVNFVRITNNFKKGVTNAENNVINTLHFILFVKLLQVLLVLTPLESVERK